MPTAGCWTPWPEIGDVVDRHQATRVGGTRETLRPHHVNLRPTHRGRDIYGHRALGQGRKLGAGRGVGDTPVVAAVAANRVDVTRIVRAVLLVSAAEGQLAAVAPPGEIYCRLVDDHARRGPEHLVAGAVRPDDVNCVRRALHVGDDSRVIGGRRGNGRVCRGRSGRLERDSRQQSGLAASTLAVRAMPASRTTWQRKEYVAIGAPRCTREAW